MAERIAPGLCPHCGYYFNRAAEAKGGDERPSPGDLGLCFSCGEPHIYQNDMTPRPLTYSDRRTLSRAHKEIIQHAKEFCEWRGPLEKGAPNA